MSDPNRVGDMVAWRVTQQSQQIGHLPNGQFVPGYLVSFVYDGNNTGTVFVPESQWSPQAVQAAITAKVRSMVDIGNLSGQA